MNVELMNLVHSYITLDQRNLYYIQKLPQRLQSVSGLKQRSLTQEMPLEGIDGLSQLTKHSTVKVFQKPQRKKIKVKQLERFRSLTC